MKNLTVSIDEQVIKNARIRALHEDTSVNSVVASFLRTYANIEEERQSPVQAILQHADSVSASSGPGGRSWRREDIYDRR